MLSGSEALGETIVNADTKLIAGSFSLQNDITKKEYHRLLNLPFNRKDFEWATSVLHEHHTTPMRIMDDFEAYAWSINQKINFRTIFWIDRSVQKAVTVIAEQQVRFQSLKPYC